MKYFINFEKKIITATATYDVMSRDPQVVLQDETSNFLSVLGKEHISINSLLLTSPCTGISVLKHSG